MYLGIKAVITKSFARIHKANLINSGILPLTFKNEEDYDKIALGDTLKLENIKSLIENGGEVILINETKGVSIPLVSDFSERQRKLLSAGGLLNYTSKSVNK